MDSSKKVRILQKHAFLGLKVLYNQNMSNSLKTQEMWCFEIEFLIFSKDFQNLQKIIYIYFVNQLNLDLF